MRNSNRGSRNNNRTGPARWTYLELAGLSVAFFLIVWPMLTLVMDTIFPSKAYAAVLTITKSVSAVQAAVGDTLTYTLVITNTSGTNDFITVTDITPTQVTIVNASGGALTATISPTRDRVVFSGPLNNGQSTTATINVQVKAGTAAGTSITNSASGTVSNSPLQSIASNVVTTSVVSITNTPAPTNTATSTVVPTFTATNTAQPTSTTTPGPTPTNTATNTVGAATNTATNVPTNTATNTPGGPTLTPTNTITPGGPTLTATSTATATFTATAQGPTPTNTATITPGGPTLTPTNTAVNTPTNSATNTAVPANTATNTAVPANTATSTATITPGGPTPSFTPTSTPSPTGTLPTATAIGTATTDTGTPTFTPTLSGSATATFTVTPTGTLPTGTPVLTFTPLPGSTATPTGTLSSSGVISGSFSVSGGGLLAGSRVLLILRSAGTGTPDIIVRDTVVDSTNQYFFASVPSNFSGQYYYVRFTNPDPGSGVLRNFDTNLFSFAGGSFRLSNIDVTDVTLGDPGNSNRILTPPFNFTWSPRSSQDIYSVRVLRSADNTPAHDSGALGGATKYTIPAGSLSDASYSAVVNIQNPLGTGTSNHQYVFRVLGSGVTPVPFPSTPTPAPITIAPVGGTGATNTVQAQPGATNTKAVASTPKPAAAAANTTPLTATQAAAIIAPAGQQGGSATFTPVVAANTQPSGEQNQPGNLPKSGGELPIFGLLLAGLTLGLRRYRLIRQV